MRFVKTKDEKMDRLCLAVREIKSAIRDGKQAYLRMGKWLCIIKSEGLWREDGSCARTFREWVGNELSISKSNAYHAIDAYEKLGDILENNPEFNDLDHSKIILLLPHINNKTTVDEKTELLHMANENPVKAIKDNLTEKSGGTATDACPHLDAELWNRCKNCGKFYR